MKFTLIYSKYKISHQNDEICHLKIRPSKIARACLVLPGLCCPKYQKPLQIPNTKYKISTFQGLPHHHGRTLLLGPISFSPASSGSSFFPHGDYHFVTSFHFYSHCFSSSSTFQACHPCQSSAHLPSVSIFHSKYSQQVK